MRSMSPDAVHRRRAVDGLAARHVIVGHDFKFARDLAGNVETLRAAGPARRVRSDRGAAVRVNGERVSSSLIRDGARMRVTSSAPRGLLGRPYRMTGRVVEGAQLGRKLGFPTANLRPQRKRRRRWRACSRSASRAAGLPTRRGLPVSARGRRWTATELLLEAHVFDFDGDLYGRDLTWISSRGCATSCGSRHGCSWWSR